MDVKKAVAEQISDGHKSGELLSNPAFKKVVDELAVEYYNDFMSAQMANPSDLLLARLKAVVLEEIVQRMEQMFLIGRSNVERMKGND